MAGGAILNDYRTDRTSSRDTLDETLTTQRDIEITDLATDCNDDDNVTFRIRNSPLKIGADWSCRDVKGSQALCVSLLHHPRMG